MLSSSASSGSSSIVSSRVETMLTPGVPESRAALEEDAIDSAQTDEDIPEKINDETFTISVNSSKDPISSAAEKLINNAGPDVIVHNIPSGEPFFMFSSAVGRYM